MAESSRRNEIREIHKTYKWFYVLMGIGVALGVGIRIGAAAFAHDPSGYAMNLVTEGMGIAVSVVLTVFVIERIYERRAEERHTSELKRRLVLQAGSRINGMAVAAIEQLRVRGWLRGDAGILKGSFLPDANLQGADLNWVDLQDAQLSSINLQETDMIHTNLQNAQLSLANLRKARLWRGLLRDADLNMANLECAELWEADLQKANFDHANLHDADLRRVDLREANLSNANLQRACLDDANLHGLILPDGVPYTHSVDMKKYTDPSHPDFFDYSEKLRNIDKIRNVR